LAAGAKAPAALLRAPALAARETGATDPGLKVMRVPWRLIAAATIVLLGLEGATLLPVRQRMILALHVALVAALAWLRRSELPSRGGLRLPLALAFAISLVPVLAGAFMPHDDARQVVVSDLLPTLTGWAILLVLLPLSADDQPIADAEWRPHRVFLPGLLMAAFVGLAIAHQLAVGPYALVSDEVVMLTQSRWMQFPQLTLPIEAELAPFFIMRKVSYLDGHLYGMYPPGWPALLSLFRTLGLEWWSSVILGTITVGLAFVLGRRLHGTGTV
jgi:hypothetical protein